MSKLGTHLRNADPLADTPALPPDEALRIRRAILAVASRPAPTWRPQPVVVAATIAATLLAGVVIGRRLPYEDPPRAVEPARRQVQFDTPGGTRIIWVIDPDFDL